MINNAVESFIKDGDSSIHDYDLLYNKSKNSPFWIRHLERASWVLKGIAGGSGLSSGASAIFEKATGKDEASIASATFSFAIAALVIVDGICQYNLRSYQTASRDLDVFLSDKTKKISDNLLKTLELMKQQNNNSDTIAIDNDLVRAAVVTRYRSLLNLTQAELVTP